MSVADDAAGRAREVVCGAPDGQPMFVCVRCGVPLTKDGLVDLGLRLPDADESRDDSMDADLIDAVRHAMCPGQ